MKNQYSGYRVEAGAAIDRVSPDIDPKVFFDEYIAKRKPCIIEGHFNDPEWTAGTKWRELDYLRKHAGDVAVSVEPRDSTTDTFGKGRKEQMALKELLALLEQGNELYYLTTQELKTDVKTGFVDVHAPPVSNLIGDLPLRPKIIGRLVPQQINFWMGNNRDGSTSGLHHDFHDNVYVLIRGRKRFTLYSPADIDKMHVRGKVAVVHANGRIVYEGTPETRPDGVELGSRVQVTDRLRTAENKIASLEKKIEEARENGADEEAERLVTLLEEEEEKLEDALADYMDHDDADDGADVDAGEYLSDLEETGGDDEEGEEGDEEEEDVGENGEIDEDDEKGDISDTNGTADGKGEEPASFSLVGSVGRPEEEIRAEFPDFFEARRLVADIKAGEMLWLPAGWFHEVHSYGDDELEGKDGARIHMAVNYWFHPIDANSYEAPYADPLWERLWLSRGLPPYSEAADADNKPPAKRQRCE